MFPFNQRKDLIYIFEVIDISFHNFVLHAYFSFSVLMLSFVFSHFKSSPIFVDICIFNIFIS